MLHDKLLASIKAKQKCVITNKINKKNNNTVTLFYLL